MDRHFFKTREEIWAEMKEHGLDSFYLYLKEQDMNPGVPEVHYEEPNVFKCFLKTHTKPDRFFWKRR